MASTSGDANADAAWLDLVDQLAHDLELPDEEEVDDNIPMLSIDDVYMPPQDTLRPPLRSRCRVLCPIRQVGTRQLGTAGVPGARPDELFIKFIKRGIGILLTVGCLGEVIPASPMFMFDK